MGWVVIMVGIIGIVPVLVVAGTYELVNLLDRQSAVSERIRWGIAVVAAIVVAWVALRALTTSG
jgi:hypothetical protein